MARERDRGILSPADRAYLRGETEFASDQSERNARARIRERVVDALLDFEVLVEHLTERDRELIFEKRLGEMDGETAFDALVSALAFLYRGVDDSDLAFETVLAEGVNVAEAGRDRAATVEFDLTFRSLSAEQLLAELRRGESLTLTELAYLHESDEVSDDRLARYLEDARESEVGDDRIQTKVTEF